MKELVPIISKAINESVQLSKQYEKATELTLKRSQTNYGFYER